MKVVYVTSTSFFDADLWYLHELSKLVDLTVLLDVPVFGLNQTSFQLEKQPAKSGLIPFTEIRELEKHNNLWGKKCFVINRPRGKRISFETIKINIHLHQFLKKLNPDIIHFNNPITQFGSTALKFPSKKILTVHDPIPHLGELKGNLKIRANNMKFVKNYLLLNEFQKTSFLNYYSLKEKQVFNTFLSSFKPINVTHSNTQSDPWNLLFFGRIAPYKGLNILVEAFKQLKTIFPKLTLTIAGKGDFNILEEPVNGIEIISRYVSTTELNELIQKSSVVICPYIEGTQSGVIMTSFGMSKPVIATNVGGFPEMIEHEKTGLLIEPNNSEALQKAILYLLNNREKLNDFSKNIDSIYHKNGLKSWEISAQKTFSAYCSL